jgi:hypothetical protein
MNFQIKGFKTWNTDDGGGYQFNLYLDKKKFAYVHNDGNGGCIDMKFYDLKFMGGQYGWDESPSAIVWNKYVKSLGQWKSDFGAINGTEWFDHDTDTAIGILVEEYEMSKHRKKGILFRLLTDSENAFRTITTHDMDLAVAFLDKQYGQGKYLLV